MSPAGGDRLGACNSPRARRKRRCLREGWPPPGADQALSPTWQLSCSGREAELHETFDMKVASQAPTGEGESLVSPLEQMLDAAVESERHHWPHARLARYRADELARPTHAALAGGRSPRGARPPARVPPPARSDTRAQAEPLGQRPASETTGWVRVCAVALGPLTVLTAFLLPVSATSTARDPAVEISALTTRTPGPPAARVRDIPVDLAKGEPRQVDADEKSRSSTLRLLDAHADAVTRSSLESEARRSSGVSASPGRSEPSRSSLGPATQQAQAGTTHIFEKRAHVVTVDDLFGVGGNEPLPPEARDAPASASPVPSHARKPAHSAAASSSLFYQKLPF